MTEPNTSGWRRRAIRQVWRYRRETALYATLATTAGLPLAIPAVRRAMLTYQAHARTRRLLIAGFRATGVAGADGRLPRISKVERTPFGERVHLRARPGHWSDLLLVRANALAAAAKARAVRVDKDPARADRITLDVVRRDPLAAVDDIPWANLADPVLSMWDPIHLGLTELGEPLWLSLVDRDLLIGGLRGTGKSTLLNNIASHAAKSPDAHLVLIDPNEVQFGPWRDRALAYASKDPDEALAVLAKVAAELDRRTGVLLGLPGVVRKITPEIAEMHGMPLWVLMIDELAYHTSVVGTPAQRTAFGTLLRDIASRGRAAGIIPIAATQRPTSSVVPRDLADLFSLRCAFRTANANNSDVILGEGWAKAGHNAADIDLASRGIGLLLAEGAKPQKFKGAWISDAQIADLSVTTIPLKPRPAPLVAPAVRGV